MNLLAFETATEACSVALWTDAGLLERFEVAPRRHAELALPWAERLLAEAGIARAQLDAVAVGRGPGAFTGVRLGIALAQGIALGLDLPVLPVSTLAALALRSQPRNAASTRVLAAIDARMGEVYTGAFLRIGDALTPLAAERVWAPEAVVLPDSGAGWTGMGTGFAAADGLLAARLAAVMEDIDATALPRAGDVARLAVAELAAGRGIAPERLEPAYLRDQVALTLAEQQSRRVRDT